MLRKPPSYIQNAGIVGAPIKYKWDNDVAMRLIEGQSARLYKALNQSNYKVRMALGVALAEWITWRFEGHADLTDPLNRVEAGWATVIDPAYVKDLRFTLTPIVHETAAVVEAPLEIALDFLGEAYARFTTGSVYLAGAVIKQALLAQHLIPKKKGFEDWLSNSLRRASEVLPRGADYDENKETYDAAHEKPVPKEFFDPEFVYTEAAAEAALRAFLQSLDPDENPYLRTPAEMTAQGFKGTPYTL